MDKLLIKSKIIHDPVHGNILLTNFAKHIIDNKYFQKLRNIKQLGTTDLIYPGANHTRFEHSIGCYYLADKLLTTIKLSTPADKLSEWLKEVELLAMYFHKNNIEPGLTDVIIESVKIAMLCHDIGHGPYSHTFDDVFINGSSLQDHRYATHEARSCGILQHIINMNACLSPYIDPLLIKFMQSLIDPQDNDNFIYMIVSNKLNGLDVDKYDYILRDSLHVGVKNCFDPIRLLEAVIVIDNKITYPEQAIQDIYNLYFMRHMLHRRVYGHKGVISAQFLIIDIMKILDRVIGITESITNWDLFNEMTDQFIIQSMNLILINPQYYLDQLSPEKFDELRELKIRYDNHQLYSHIGSHYSVDQIDIPECFAKPEYLIYTNKIGFVSGNKSNPLDNIYIYKTKDLLSDDPSSQEMTSMHINKYQITNVMPNVYQEYIMMIFHRGQHDEQLKLDKQKFLELYEF